MNGLSEETIAIEWTKFYGKFEELGLTEYYDMDKLQKEVCSSPCATNEDSGTAYKGALLMHIIMLMGLSQRIAKMISGTFTIDENSLLKVCALIHLSKRFLYEESTNDWDIKNGRPFKFVASTNVLKTGDKSILEAMNNGVKFTDDEYEAMKCLDEDDPTRRPFEGIMATVIRQANDLAYKIEKERYKKIKSA